MTFIKKRLHFFILLIITLFIQRQSISSEDFKINSYTYILQADKLAKSKSKAIQALKNCNKELIILDSYYNIGIPWTKDNLRQIHSGMPERKIVAYISIGEAEAYREYWKKSWAKPSTRPDYILDENPDWAGNYKVKYWNKEWQSILYSEIKKIINAGFDGVFLDIVDAFEYFERTEDEYIDYKINPETGNSYRADMIELVKIIYKQLNQDKQGQYLIIPQNGSQLLESQIYQDIISLQAIEDLFTNGNKKQPLEHSKYILSFLSSLKNNNKQIIVTEYPTKTKFKNYSISQANKHSLVLLLTSRALDKIGKNNTMK